MRNDTGASALEYARGPERGLGRDRRTPAGRLTRVVLVGLALLGSSAPLCGCHRESAAEERPDPGPPRRVRCAPVETRSVRTQVVLHGTVAPLPDRDAQIAPQVPGRILAVLVREGDQVARGQPLARVDAAALSDQVKEADAQLAKAQAEAGLARTTRARIDRVFQRGIAARQELDDAEARVATAQAGESEARAAAEIARRQLDRASVRSPLRGVVLKLFRKTGELVDGTPATPIVEVGDPERLELVASATAAELVRVHVRDVARVEVPSLPDGNLRGTVAAVSPAVDRATGLGSVRITLHAGTGTRPPVGVSGLARIQTGVPREATLVPTAALRAASGDDGEIVVCGTDRKAHVVHVRRASSSDEAGVGLTEVRLSALAQVPAAPQVPGTAVNNRTAVNNPTSASSSGLVSGTASGAGSGLVSGTVVAVDPVLGLADGDLIEQGR
jgi:RND family efflux transporter MFP subunit